MTLTPLPPTISVTPPGQSGVSGPIVHGQSTTITGSGFGTRPDYNMGNWTWKGQRYIHHLWCDFSEVTPPTPSGNANTDFINWKSAGLNGMYPTFYDPSGNFGAPRSIALDGSGVASGGPSFGGKYWQRGPNADVAAGQRYGGLTLQISGTPAGVSNISTSYPGEYVSYKYQATGFETTIGNEKSYRRSYNFNALPIGSSSNGLEYIWNIINSATGISNLPTGGPTWGNPLESQIHGSGLFGLHNQVNFVSQFNRIQIWTDANGNLQQYCNRNPAIVWSNSQIPAGVTILPMWFQTYPTPWGNWSNATAYNINDTSSQCLVTWCSESGINAPYNQNVTDIYFDFTPARVEVTDGTHAEPQILTSWSDTQVQFLGNQGQLTAGAGTANVYDNTNTIIQSFPVNIGTVPFDYFISTTGSDSNAGTLASPWAITAINTKRATYAGKRVGIMPGTYPLSSMMTTDAQNVARNPALNINGGASSAARTYIASCDASGNYSPRTATLTANDNGVLGGQTTSTNAIIGCNNTVTNRGHWILDGLKITGASLWAIHIGNSPSGGVNITDWTIQNCEIYGCSTATATNAAGVNCGAMIVYTADNYTVTNNYWHDNTRGGVNDADHYSCVYVWGELGPVSGTFAGTYSYNTLKNSAGLHGKEANQQGNSFFNNYIEWTGSNGGQNSPGIMGFDGAPTAGLTQPTTIHHNVLVVNGQGINVEAELSNGGYSTALSVYNNTIVSTASLVQYFRYFEKTAGTNLLSFYNNLWVDAGHTPSTNYGYMLVNADAFALCDYNCYGGAAGSQWNTVANGTHTSAGATNRTFANWKATINGGADAHSLNTAATLTNAGTYAKQYTVTTGAAFGAGKVGGVIGGASCNMGAWDGTVTQIGASWVS